MTTPIQCANCGTPDTALAELCGELLCAECVKAMDEEAESMFQEQSAIYNQIVSDGLRRH